jgi:hypothetical protein
MQAEMRYGADFSHSWRWASQVFFIPSHLLVKPSGNTAEMAATSLCFHMAFILLVVFAQVLSRCRKVLYY